MKTFEQWLKEPQIVDLDLSQQERQLARLGWTSALLASSDAALAAIDEKLKATA